MILLRHGESRFNAAFAGRRVDPQIPDAPLTEAGKAQALAAASRLAAEHRITRILASPYTRALQTASIVARTLDLPVTVDRLVGERAALSCDIGSPVCELALEWPHLDFSHLPERWWPEIEETEEAFRARAAEFEARMAGLADRHEVLVVSHWGFIRALTGIEAGNCQIVVHGKFRDGRR